VFQEAGFNLAGIFDIAPDLIGTDIGGKVVGHVEGLGAFLAACPVRLAIIATPAEPAHAVAEVLSGAGVQGVLNLSPVDLMPVDGMRITNVNLTDKLLSLSWMIANRWEENSGDVETPL
jgi:redox-sensing transcriptional repressor